MNKFDLNIVNKLISPRITTIPSIVTETWALCGPKFCPEIVTRVSPDGLPPAGLILETDGAK